MRDVLRFDEAPVVRFVEPGQAEADIIKKAVLVLLQLRDIEDLYQRAHAAIKEDEILYNFDSQVHTRRKNRFYQPVPAPDLLLNLAHILLAVQLIHDDIKVLQHQIEVLGVLVLLAQEINFVRSLNQCAYVRACEYLHQQWRGNKIPRPWSVGPSGRYEATKCTGLGEEQGKEKGRTREGEGRRWEGEGRRREEKGRTSLAAGLGGVRARAGAESSASSH